MRPVLSLSLSMAVFCLTSAVNVKFCHAGVLERLERIMVPAAGAQSVILGALSRMQVRQTRSRHEQSTWLTVCCISWTGRLTRPVGHCSIMCDMCIFWLALQPRVLRLFVSAVHRFNFRRR